MDFHIARQPVLDREEKIFAYELLFRPSQQSQTSSLDQRTKGNFASGRVLIGSYNVIGFEKLTRGKIGLVNFTEDLLLEGLPDTLNAAKIGVELLETIEISPKLLGKIKELKEKNFLLLIDDYTPSEKNLPLLDLVDIIKVDFLKDNKQEILAIKELAKKHNCQLLAEKVDNRQDYNWAYEQGFDYFQGYYFAKPRVVSDRALPSMKLNYLRLFIQINKEEPDFAEMENIIKSDPLLSYELLKMINSAYFGFIQDIDSIRQALTLLGLTEVSKWLNLFIVSQVGNEHPSALIVTTWVRCRFAEKLAPLFQAEEKSMQVFLLALFSLLDTFLNSSLPDLLSEFNLTPEIHQALTEKTGKYADIISLVRAYEKGQFNLAEEIMDRHNLCYNNVAKLYQEVLNKATEEAEIMLSMKN